MKSKSATQHKPSSAKTDTGSLTCRPPSKLEKCLMTFLGQGLKGVHTLDQQVASISHVKRMEATGKYWTSCLNTDVSTMKKKGIQVSSKFEPYQSAYGYVANFKRYWLADSKAALKAVKQVNLLRQKRKATTLQMEQIKGFLSPYLRKEKVSDC
ncbi:hypothetical protein ACFOD0_04220 [Shewanella intestini]|uniref:Uncharacterized protein n=1 Tax=Shewanella intestini TaxID=2017544 RepID=A0ABS5I0F7_9GAMM|nr:MULTISPECIES: hypothetical protein [Shewanella]MBR9727508.1 hypothetical protein [Shewanella intestini]MRG35342.1 hypothetical protein [Shewanella sp. XMDDZSB0408]